MSSANTVSPERDQNVDVVPVDDATPLGPLTTIPYDQPVTLASSGTPLLNPRSCMTCRRRKVRCDKSMPCTNCRRAQIPCVYPAPGRAPRRVKPREPSTTRVKDQPTKREIDLARRLQTVQARLDGLSRKVRGNADGSSAGGRSPRSAGSSPRGSLSSASGATAVGEMAEDATRSTERGGLAELRRRPGRLVLQGGGKTRYVDNRFLARLNDEVSEVCPGASQTDPVARPDTRRGRNADRSGRGSKSWRIITTRGVPGPSQLHPGIQFL